MSVIDALNSKTYQPSVDHSKNVMGIYMQLYYINTNITKNKFKSFYLDDLKISFFSTLISLQVLVIPQ